MLVPTLILIALGIFLAGPGTVLNVLWGFISGFFKTIHILETVAAVCEFIAMMIDLLGMVLQALGAVLEFLSFFTLL